jgi:SpoVK/Ycf46/Vps4 family AAA+-type ATPase
VAEAANLARWRAPAAPRVTTADLFAACRALSNPKLGALARKIEPRHGWDDLVLPREQVGQLREIADFLTYRHLVYGDWGFGRKLSLGRGYTALFAGAPGTGKTMAAEVIARETSLDLYRIDLSQVVSKYIGETEKNLDRVFAEAETSNAILFFDEADALFGKRSEVKDAHDRYANIETGYLLTCGPTSMRRSRDACAPRSSSPCPTRSTVSASGRASSRRTLRARPTSIC